MAYQTLMDFIGQVEKENAGDVFRIKNRVSRSFEATAIALELERQGKNPIIIFENIEGSKIPVVMGIYGTRQRFAQALGVPKEMLMEEWLHRGENPIKPNLISKGPVKEVFSVGKDIDLETLPILTHFQQDAGPYITAGILVAKDPDTGVVNASFHRLQVKGRDKLGVSLHSRRHLWDYQRRAEEAGQPLEVAIVIGVHPLFCFGGGLWKGPMDVDEYEVIGSFMGSPLEVVQAETLNLLIPAHAEIVIEGEILPHVREPEGPFGEFTGYASSGSTRHVIQVKAILHRKSPLYQDIIPGFSNEHSLLLGIPQEPRIYQAVKAAVPTVKAVSYPLSGTCRFHCYISLKKTAEGQPKNAIFSAFAEDLSLKLVVVVDEDIDVTDEKQVLWAIATRMQADQAVFIVPRCMGALLDPSSNEGLTAKMGIDATKPLKGWNSVKCVIPEEVKQKVKENLRVWGL